jgi:hypothetical protein
MREPAQIEEGTDLHTPQPTELAADTRSRYIGTAQASATTIRTLPDGCKPIATDPRSEAGGVSVLLGQQDEPPRR